MNKLNVFVAVCGAIFCNVLCANAQNYKNGHEWVDLGLSVKWATCNVGATKPEAYGNYYAWGEIKTKSTYSWDKYKYGTYNYDYYNDYSKLTKYNTTDGKTTLEAADDAAAVNWGGKWRMPTDAEWTELREKCTWTWTSNYNGTGVAGYEVKSQINGNSIFLPAAGSRDRNALNDAGSDGSYWSSSLYADVPYDARFVYFFSDYVGRRVVNRYVGLSVRPVLK